MSNIQTGAPRKPDDGNSHLIFSAGEIGRLQTLSVIPVIGGDSYQSNLVGSLKLSPLRRGLSMDSIIDVFTFYVPHRYAYGNDEWERFLQEGVDGEALPSGPSVAGSILDRLSYLGQSSPTGSGGYDIPKWLPYGYWSIWNNFFKYPYDENTFYGTDGAQDPNKLSPSDGIYGWSCANLKTIWNTPLPPEKGGREFNIPTSGEGAELNLQDLNQAYGALHSKQERELFANRTRDIVKMLGGSTTADFDFRPRLLKRTSQWASGYDVDGTSEVSLGQYTGRVTQSLSHRTPRFFVPEHGAVWTVALVRFPPVPRSERDYLVRKAAPTYSELIADPVVVANHPPVDTKVSDFFFEYGTTHDPIGKIPHSQWYRYKAPVVHSDYVDLQGFPFLSKDLDFQTYDGVPPYIRSDNYDDIFQTTQLAQWNMQAKNNVKILRTLPTARDSIMTSS